MRISRNGIAVARAARGLDTVGRKVGARAVKVKHRQAAWGFANVVDLSNRLLAAVAALVKVNSGTQPVKLVRQCGCVNLCHAWPVGGNAQSLKRPGPSKLCACREARVNLCLQLSARHKAKAPRPRLSSGRVGGYVRGSTCDDAWPRVIPRDPAGHGACAWLTKCGPVLADVADLDAKHEAHPVKEGREPFSGF